jgi:hypothetical protein
LRISWLRHHVDLAADVLGARQQVGDGDLFLDPVAGAVQLALAHAGQVEHRLAQRLGRDGAGVDADAAEHVAALDDRDRLAELGRRDRGLLAAGTGTDDDEVVARLRAGEIPRTRHRRSR